jgi:hypothetical protein
MTTTTTKAAAWRRAAYVLACYFDGPRDDVEAHILAAVVPSLVRRAEIIERRRKVGR